jgi:hypothetical protein
MRAKNQRSAMTLSLALNYGHLTSMKRTAFLLIVALILAIAAPANAVKRTDKNDTKGKLDLRGLNFASFHGKAYFDITTWDPWKPADLAGKINFIGIAMSASGTSPRVRVEVYQAGGKLVAPIRNLETKKRIGKARVKYQKPNKLSVRMSLGIVPKLKKKLWVIFLTYYKGKACSKTCIDYSPAAKRWWIFSLRPPGP